MGTANLKSKRYATQKDMLKLTDAVNKLSEQMLEVSAWQTYHILKETPQSIPADIRKDILSKNIGILRFLYEQLFRNNPLPIFALNNRKQIEVSK
jgi:hypothetical protein